MLDFMMQPNEVEFLIDSLNYSDVMLEWGSGGSTTHLQYEVNKLYSIEHDNSWANKVFPHLDETLVKNKQMNYCIAFPDNIYWEEQFNSDSRKNDKGDDGDLMDFATYVTLPLTFNQKFDIILIDGRARVACALMAYQLLSDSPHSRIFIHDFGDQGNHPTLGYRKYYDRVYNFLDLEHTEGTLACFKKKCHTISV